MASNQTQHYQLSQWEASDKVERLDFNIDNAKVDAALHDLAVQTANKAESSMVRTLANTVDQKAEQTALLELEGRTPRIVVGTYIGTGTQGSADPCVLDFSGTLGRAPQLVVIRKRAESDSVEFSRGLTLIHGMSSTVCYLCRSSVSGATSKVTWSGTGVSWYTENSGTQMNEKGVEYCYFAIG